MVRSTIVFSALVVMLGAFGCSDGPVTGDGACVDNSSCGAGSVCNDGHCAQLCTGDRECATGEICSQGLCGAGVRSGGPEISFIDGDGGDLPQPADDRGTPTGHRLRQRMSVHGLYLEGASLTLVSELGAVIDLLIESSSSGEIIAALPNNVGEGHHVLTATNSAGSDQVEVWLLRGEKGDPGNPQTALGVLTLLQSLGTPVSGLHAQTAATADSATTATTANAASALLDSGSVPHTFAELALKADAVPPGAVMHFATAACPTGWIAADGTTVSRAAFPALFAAIGTTFGAGDGSTTFVKPDLRGEFIRSLDGGRGVDAARALGSAQGQDFKSFAMNNNGPGGYSHINGTFPKSGLSTTNVFGGYWASPAGQINIEWDGSEIRPRNIALLACLKI